MNALPTQPITNPVFLTPDQLDAAGQQALARLQETGYAVQCGVTEQQLDEIIAVSALDEIREYCPNDSTKRFRDHDAALEWLGKGRLVVLLVEQATQAVAGYGWLGAEPSPHIAGSDMTLAVRIVPAHQGRRLATPYSQVLVSVALAQGAQGLWLEAWQSNAGAVHVYGKLGFALVDQAPADRPSVGVQTAVPDVRLFMQYQNTL